MRSPGRFFFNFSMYSLWYHRWRKNPLAARLNYVAILLNTCEIIEILTLHDIVFIPDIEYMILWLPELGKR